MAATVAWLHHDYGNDSDNQIMVSLVASVLIILNPSPGKQGDVGLMFGQRRRWWINIKPALGQLLMFNEHWLFYSKPRLDMNVDHKWFYTTKLRGMTTLHAVCDHKHQRTRKRTPCTSMHIDRGWREHTKLSVWLRARLMVSIPFSSTFGLTPNLEIPRSNLDCVGSRLSSSYMCSIVSQTVQMI